MGGTTLGNKTNSLHYSITKALFYIQSTASNTGSMKGPYEVLFNPSELSISADKSAELDVEDVKEENSKVICYAKSDDKIDESNESCVGINTASNNKLVEWVSMDLIFDLVETYEDSKEKDTNLLSLFTGSSTDKISVLDSSWCSLPEIIAAFENSYRVRFVWGSNIEFKGWISNMDVSLQYFSPKGSPLRANARLTIRTEDCEDSFSSFDMLGDLI